MRPPPDSQLSPALTGWLDLLLALPVTLVGVVWGMLVALMLALPVVICGLMKPQHAAELGLWLRDRVRYAVRGDWEEPDGEVSES